MTAIDVLRREVNELMTVDLARSHRDDLVCVETVFIVQEARVQMVERFATVISQSRGCLHRRLLSFQCVPQL
jgi:hypothetical protein